MINLFHAPGERAIEAEAELTVEAFMARKHKSLGNCFKMEDGIHDDSCTLIAFDIAFSLIEAGHNPTIGTLRGREIKNGTWIGNEPLVPRRFEGRKTFGGHSICICDGDVYDPMVSEIPVPVEKYLQLAFANTDVEFEPKHTSTDYIKARLNEIKSGA